MSDAYVINSFSQAYLIPYFRRIINKNKFKIMKDIEEKFKISNAVVKDVFTGLKFFKFIKVENNVIYDCEPPRISSDISEDQNFKLYLLSRFKEETGYYPDWEKNAVCLLIIEYLIKINQVLVETNDKHLIEAMNQYFSKDRQYNPTQSGSTVNIKLAENKLKNWCQIFQYIGFLTRISSKLYLFSLNIDLLYSLFTIFPNKLKGGIVPLKKFIDWVNDNYLLIPMIGYKIPEMLSKALYSLCKEKRIRLIAHGNLPLMDLKNKPRYLNIATNINAIEIIE